MDFKYTSRQTARGSRPDGQFGSTYFLVKNVSRMRLTYQVKLLTLMAQEQRGVLVVQLPKGAKTSRDLRAFAKSHRGSVRVERFEV